MFAAIIAASCILSAGDQSPPKSKSLPDLLAWVEAGEPRLTESRLRVGAIGTASLEISQITGDLTALCYFPRRSGGLGMGVLIKGIEFGDVVDGEYLKFPPMWVTGTTRYPTVTGGTKQVYVLEPVNRAAVVRCRADRDRRKREREWQEAWAKNRRMWRDKSGRFEVEAMYAGSKPGKVVLEKADRTKLEVDLKVLDEKDRLLAVRTTRKRARQFIGRWRLIDGKGTTVGRFDMLASFEARKDHAPDVAATWVIVGNKAHTTWDDGWKDILRKESSKVFKDSFGPDTGWDETPDNTFECRRE